MNTTPIVQHPLRCQASCTLDRILTVRNCQEKDETNWHRELAPPSLRDQAVLPTIIIVTGAYLVLTEVVAVVETVVYTALTLISLIFYPCTSRPFCRSVQLLQSSSFCIVWIATTFLLNPFLHRLHTKESFVRAWWAERISPCLLRNEDLRYIKSWEEQRPTSHIVDETTGAPEMSRVINIANRLARARGLLAEST